tara:strand:+ start:494 stop:3289 length:2796 start_codon:yes stop_codon:yes gene_type:complete
MASITQTIPNYVGGISEQPDQLKFPGQVKDVVNAIPDVTRGLYKRPGSKRIGSSPLSSVQSGGSWFHYHRDEDEGSYIGQVAADGQVRVWRCSDGTLMTTAYGTGGQTAIQNYLATNEPENLQFLTINDTTFISSRDSTNSNTLVGTTGSAQAYPDAHFAFVELIRTENGRQYALNAYDDSSTTTINRATRVEIISDTLDESTGTGQCRGIGVQVFSVNSGSKTNLTFKLNTLGQQGQIQSGNDVEDFACSYSRQITLLHGGEGWVTGDQVTVTMTQAKGRTVTGSIANNASTKGESSATYTIQVTDHEAIAVKANIKAIRPTPTPFDADTAITVDTILGGLQAEFSGTGITATVIGNGLYLTKSSAFNIEIVEDDLMRNMGTSVNDVTLLPKQCKHGFIVKVSNARMSDEDDYYLRFEGENNLDGTGSWTECAKPGIVTSFTNMPIVIQRTATTTFTVKQFTYADRAVGDDQTNPIPSFVGKRINKVLFFRNRLAFLSGENVVLCKPGTVGIPNFWSETALVVSANDPIDIACSSTFPSELFDGIDINTGLVVFSTNQQFLLSSDDTVLNPDTAKLRSIATFNYNKTVPPISLGVTIAYLDNSGKFSRFNEMANVAREGEPNVVDQSKVIPTTISKDVDLLTNSRENQLVAIGKTGSDTVIGFRYLNVADKRQQSAWFKWKFNNPLTYHFIVNDEYFFLDSDYFLQSMRLVQQDSDPSITQDNVEFLLHVDNHTTISGGSFSAATNLTTFSSVSWLPNVTSPNYDLVVVDTNTASTRVGRYAKPTTTSTTSFTLPGDWSGVTLTIGYIYEYSVKFPRVYYTRTEGQRFLSDVNSSLVVHRVKFHFGKVGLYETTLERVGKTDYTEVYESTILDEYNVSDAPYLDEYIKTIPVYEQNTNVDITLKSSHPAPSTLRSMTWEGYYSPRYYKRA